MEDITRRIIISAVFTALSLAIFFRVLFWHVGIDTPFGEQDMHGIAIALLSVVMIFILLSAIKYARRRIQARRALKEFHSTR